MRRLVLLVGVAVAVIFVSPAAASRHQVRKAPSACTNAIAQARQVATFMKEALTDVQPLFTMVPAAAEAGVRQNTAQVYAIAAHLKKIDAQLNALAGRVGPVVLQFNVDAAGCH